MVLPIHHCIIRRVLRAIRLIVIRCASDICNCLLHNGPTINGINFTRHTTTIHVSKARMNIRHFHLFFNQMQYYPSILSMIGRSTSHVYRCQIIPYCSKCRVLFPRGSYFTYGRLNLYFLPLHGTSDHLLGSSSLPIPSIPPYSVRPVVSSSGGWDLLPLL